MHQVKPGIVMITGRIRRGVVLFFLLFGVALTTLSFVLAVDSFTRPDESHAIDDWQVSLAMSLLNNDNPEISVRLLFSLATIVGGLALWDFYAAWLMVSARRGFLDYEFVPTGLRLVQPRTWGRARALVVSPGEAVTLQADLLRKRRGKPFSDYRFTIATPRESFTFDASIHLGKLSMVPLEEAAPLMGIAFTTTGAAQEIRRRDSITAA